MDFLLGVYAKCLAGQQDEAERQARHDLAGPLELSPVPGPELVQLMGALKRASERLASRPRHGSTAGRSGLAYDVGYVASEVQDELEARLGSDDRRRP